MEYLYKLMNRSHDKNLSPSNVAGTSLGSSSMNTNNNVIEDDYLSKSVSFFSSAFLSFHLFM